MHTLKACCDDQSIDDGKNERDRELCPKIRCISTYSEHTAYWPSLSNLTEHLPHFYTHLWHGDTFSCAHRTFIVFIPSDSVVYAIPFHMNTLRLYYTKAKLSALRQPVTSKRRSFLYFFFFLCFALSSHFFIFLLFCRQNAAVFGVDQWFSSSINALHFDSRHKPMIVHRNFTSASKVMKHCDYCIKQVSLLKNAIDCRFLEQSKYQRDFCFCFFFNYCSI